MNKLQSRIKIGVVILLALFVVFGCKKSEELYSPVKEALMIRAWVDDMVKNKYVVDSTATGVYYVIEKVGTGSNVQAGNNITVAYTGKFLDGTAFDASSSYAYIHKASNQRMIPGWEEGIEKLSRGGIGVFLIPSAQAYGPNGYLVVPPYTPLFFRIEIISIQ